MTIANFYEVNNTYSPLQGLLTVPFNCMAHPNLPRVSNYNSYPILATSVFLIALAKLCKRVCSAQQSNQFVTLYCLSNGAHIRRFQNLTEYMTLN